MSADACPSAPPEPLVVLGTVADAFGQGIFPVVSLSAGRELP